MDTIFGLPAHPLLVHVPVVLVPMAALGALGLVFVPSWRSRFGPLVVALAFIGALGTVLAAHSGESFEHKVDRTTLVVRHAELGRSARLLSVLFFVALVAYVGFDRWRAHSVAARPARNLGAAAATGAPGATGLGAAGWVKPASIVLSALVAVTSVTSTVWIVRAGHKGAEAAWHGVTDKPQGG